MSKVIQALEQRQLRKDLPQFKAGDTAKVHFRVIEGSRSRIQVFEGVVIKRQGAGVRETFARIEITQVGDVNRAPLYYLRKKVGKKARVRAKQYGGPVFSTDAPTADEEADELDEDVDEPEPEAEPVDEQGDEAEPAPEEDGEKAT